MVKKKKKKKDMAKSLMPQWKSYVRVNVRTRRTYV